MKISIKLISGFLTVALLVGVIGYFGFTGTQGVFESFDVIADETAPELSILGKIEAEVHRLQLEAVHFALISAEAQEEEAAAALLEELEEFDETNKELDEAIKALEEIEGAEEEHEAAEEELQGKIKETKEELYNAALALINAKKEGKSGQEILDLIEELEEIEEEFDELIDSRISAETTELEERDEIADKLAASTTNLILIVGSIALLLAVGLGLYISHSISKPIKELTKASEKLKKGNLNYKIDVKSSDEIGQLAETFNEMRLGLKDRNQLLNSILNSFKGKFGNLAVIVMRKNIQELVKKNPRIKDIIPKEMERSINLGKNLKK